jgi:hypothetical protein
MIIIAVVVIVAIILAILFFNGMNNNPGGVATDVPGGIISTDTNSGSTTSGDVGVTDINDEMTEVEQTMPVPTEEATEAP